MKLHCKQCKQTKKIKSLNNLACDEINCSLRHPGQNEVLGFEDVKINEKTRHTIIEEFETPPSATASTQYPDFYDVG